MASCLCRYRRRILFFCLSCILLLPIYIYVSMVLIYIIKHGAPGVPPVLQTHFAASGLKFSGDLAPHPVKAFWRSKLNSGAQWNVIQYMMDIQHNPILKPRLAANRPGISYKTERSRRSGNGCSPNYEINNTIPDFFNLPTQMKDFVTSMHCREYPLIIDALDVCDGGPLAKKRAPTLLLAIKTQPADFVNREAIRETWGRSGRIKSRGGRQRLVRRVFLLGKSKDLHIEEKLQLESDKYGDIIQWEFMDTFFNLTLKDVLFWDWFSRRCTHARFIFKGDDDIFVRTPALLDYLLAEEANGFRSNKMEAFVVGDVINSAAPVRSNGSKYYIPESFFKGVYPSYPGGGGVVYSGSLAHRLLEVSQKVHLFPIDDVYLGMCLQRLGVYPIHHPAFLTFDFPKDEPKEPCAYHTILLVHKRSPAEMFQLWTETSMPSSECRNATLRVKTRVEFR
ncbi:N-acetyllactosaminide beta-1,3-N-acetylglucosaminyltransferase 2 [Siphateles boraxobius]|uniref:N-acetyllactosaminide beta-1,3-N-acetylglucosaminyltransferase 2 n=1 Tax=Siphateles boraxobius TaxID=180520 RepID=UPI00406473C7